MKVELDRVQRGFPNPVQKLKKKSSITDLGKQGPPSPTHRTDPRPHYSKMGILDPVTLILKRHVDIEKLLNSLET